MITTMNLDEYKKSVNASEERFDGDFDVMFADISKSEEDLNFIETFGKMESVNTKAKLDMLNKINKAYGSCHRGIENYCREQSLEADSVDNNVDNDSNTNVDKKKKWYQILWQKIKDLFNKVKNLFIALWNKIKLLFDKNERIVRLIEKAPEKELQALSNYLTESSFDSFGHFVTINVNTPKLLIENTNSFVQASKQYQTILGTLIQRGSIEDVKSFLKSYIESMPDDIRMNRDYNFDVTTDNIDVIYNKYKKLFDDLSNSYDYSKNCDLFLSEYNSKLIDENKKVTVETLMGTKDVKKILMTFKELKTALNVVDKNVKEMLEMGNNADSTFNKYVKDSDNLQVIGICTNMFKVYTKSMSVYFKIVGDFNKTMSNIINKINVGCKMYISSLKNIKTN